MSNYYSEIICFKQKKPSLEGKTLSNLNSTNFLFYCLTNFIVISRLLSSVAFTM